MDSAVSNARLEEWLRHEGCLRKTLRGLLASEADVEDALQQTWTKLLERRVEVPEKPRGWLVRVARNVALGGLRARRRRADHEARASAGAGADSPADSAARLEALQRVASAILALEEPYRAVVLLRHEQELDVAAIAKKLGRSEATVRSQLSRAHELLRRKLDREFGGRERWAVLALPLVVKPALVPVALASALALVVAGGWMLRAFWNARATRPETPVALATTPEPEPGSTAGFAREPLESATSEPTHQEAPPPGASSGSLERHLAAAELLDREYYHDILRAGFSLELGARRDLVPERTDADIELDKGWLHVSNVVDDTGLMVDLGARAPEELSDARLGVPPFAVRMHLEPGHAYFAWVLDPDTDLACLLFVRELEPGRRALLDWYATDGTGRAQGSLREDGLGEPLVDLLVRLRAEAMAHQGYLATPEVLMQARMGAGGGNTNRVHMNGELHRIDELSPVPLELDAPIALRERSRAHLVGGWLPPGRALRVMRVEYRGRADGDSNGDGEFAVVVGGETLVALESPAEPVHEIVGVDLLLRAGDEARTFLALSNSSAGEVRLSGRFEPDASVGFGRASPGFFAPPAEPAPGTERPVLVRAEVVLQLRAGAGGGNPNRLAMHGQTSVYVDRIESAPLDLTQPPKMQDEALAYFEGGLVPAGQTFVVTAARWWGTSAGDMNGHGELKLVVAGTTLVEERDGKEPSIGSWNGRLLVRPDEESRTYLEIANSSAGDVLLTGYFEPLAR